MMNSQIVPQGYKQTKVGVIPEDWKEFQLKDILNLTLESLKMEDEKEYELITVRRRFGGVDSRGVFKGKKILVKNQFYVRENDFVISKRQISHGACGLVLKELDGAIVSNEYNVFKPNKDLLDQVFFNYYVRVPKFNQTFYSYSDGIHIEKLLFKTQSWLKQKIPFPPLKEQQRIAQILSTWDDAISKQEALIKAKEELKKGLMQKLLSGEVRFDGFDGEWEEVRLGDKFDFIKTYSNSRSHLSDVGDMEYMHYGDIHTKYKFHIDLSKVILPKISESNIKGTIEYVKNGDLIIADASEDYADIGKSVEVVNLQDKKVISGLHTFLLRDNDNNFSNGYKGLMLYNQKVAKEIKKIATGISVLGISKTNLSKLYISLPPKQEQQKIAEVLTLADKDIELLKNELEALKEQKHGLMQKLLSGEVRVGV